MPKYPHMTVPRFTPIYMAVVINIGNVRKSIIKQNATDAKYFPIIKTRYSTGCVNKNSMVPLRYSSLHSGIQIAGINKDKISGWGPNKDMRFELSN